ncbi:hypothetical protein TorRG33x02_068550 [Trema orientale]|uniref:Uncharacterized protein n=1 Tax=Trema orientale TaxID=63057 RepID=A0A2P5FHW8_TREOI|nr:hypothetical protein TorRG33x02_068550 [Trema orientale]
MYGHSFYLQSPVQANHTDSPSFLPSFLSSSSSSSLKELESAAQVAEGLREANQIGNEAILLQIFATF